MLGKEEDEVRKEIVLSLVKLVFPLVVCSEYNNKLNMKAMEKLLISERL